MSAPATGIKPNGDSWTTRDVQIEDEDKAVWTMKVYKGAMDQYEIDDPIELDVRITIDLVNLVS